MQRWTSMPTGRVTTLAGVVFGAWGSWSCWRAWDLAHAGAIPSTAGTGLTASESYGWGFVGFLALALVSAVLLACSFISR